MLYLKRTDDDGWYVAEHRAEHNHALSDSCGEKINWPSHSRIDIHTKGLIRHLRDNNVSLGKVYAIIASFFGTIRDIPFNKRALCSLCHQMAQLQADDDIHKTMSLFDEMARTDPHFSYRADLDSEGRIHTLLWADGRNKFNYKCFGDVGTFDTMYRNNLYDMPFGLFVGVSNHFQTCIFAGVLFREETVNAFKWAFKEFTSLMGAGPPKTILTGASFFLCFYGKMRLHVCHLSHDCD